MNSFERGLSFLFLITYLIKTHIQGADYADSIIIAGLAGFVSFLCYLGTKQQPDIKAELLAEIESREAELKKTLKKQDDEITRLKDDVGQVGIVAQRNGGNVQQYKF